MGKHSGFSLVPIGMCYAYQKPKLCYTEEQAMRLRRINQMRPFECERCGAWHFSKMDEKAKPNAKVKE